MRSLPRRLPLLLALLASTPAVPAAGQQSVAALKLSPQDARGRTLTLQGEVVEVRALSPRSLQGFYRLLDGTDPIGVLIRTTDLPTSGGPFRIEARLSQEVLRDGLLLLDETGRRDIRAWQRWTALGLALIGLLALGTIIALYLRAAREERQRRLAPPLWLIPAEQDPEAPLPPDAVPPPAQIDFDADEDERLELEILASQKRRVLRWMAPAGVLAVAGTAWAAVVWRAEAGQPSFVLLEAVGPGGFTVAAPGSNSPERGDTVFALRPDLAQELAVLPRGDSARRRRPRGDSVATPLATAAPAPAPAAPAREPEPMPQAPASAAPTPVVTSPAMERPAPEPARPDPAALRRMAESELDGGINRFVSAVVGKQPASAASLYASSDSRRAKFLEFLTQYQPEAAMLGAETPTIGETSAEAVFRLNFRWRGDFGVARRKDARFIATARRAGNTWDFESIRLLENLP